MKSSILISAARQVNNNKWTRDTNNDDDWFVSRTLDATTITTTLSSMLKCDRIHVKRCVFFTISKDFITNRKEENIRMLVKSFTVIPVGNIRALLRVFSECIMRSTVLSLQFLSLPPYHDTRSFQNK